MEITAGDVHDGLAWDALCKQVMASVPKAGVPGSDGASRKTGHGMEIYALSKEIIERGFADAKDKHGIRYTHRRGLVRVSSWLRLKFAVLNLKKLALWRAAHSLLHTLEHIADSLPIANGFYLNGDFAAVKRFIAERNSVKGKIRFFLGYSGWESGQLHQEIQENTWLVDKADMPSLMDERTDSNLWKDTLGKLGGKYEMWSRFPQIPTLN